MNINREISNIEIINNKIREFIETIESYEKDGIRTLDNRTIIIDKKYGEKIEVCRSIRGEKNSSYRFYFTPNYVVSYHTLEKKNQKEEVLYIINNNEGKERDVEYNLTKNELFIVENDEIIVPKLKPNNKQVNLIIDRLTFAINQMKEIEPKDLNEERKICAQKMLDNIKKSLGNKVICTYWKHGELKNVFGVLNSFLGSINICVGNTMLPFIGQAVAIASIIDEKGNILYKNPYIKQNFDSTNKEEIEENIRLMFGEEKSYQKVLK